MLKANHNSGPVFIFDDEVDSNNVNESCREIESQLKVDYGRIFHEGWYSCIPRKFILEKKIIDPGNNDLLDFKFHVFAQNDGSQLVILGVDYDRTSNHNRSFFDVNLDWLPFSIFVPAIKTSIVKPVNYEEMVRIAKKLALPFSYVRVDLFNVDGRIYFGEMTFAPGAGYSRFSSESYDAWMGKLWQGDHSL